MNQAVQRCHAKEANKSADAKTKKRIQNREAQRAYRQRMKDRIATLESQLEANDDRNQMALFEKENPDNSHSQWDFLQLENAEILRGTQCNPSNPRMSMSQSIPSMLSVFQATDFDTTQSLPSCSPGSSDKHNSSSANEGNATRTALANDNQTIDELNAASESLIQDIIQSSSDSQALNDTAITHSSSSVLGDSAFDPIKQVRSSLPAKSGTASHTSSEQRMLSVLESANRMKFDNFDELIRLYYIGNFQNSRLQSVQRLSRNRKLPSIISDLLSAAPYWSSWERRGLEDEVLKATEFILTSECTQLTKTFDNILQAQSSENTLNIEGAARVMRSQLPIKLPNTWATMMAIADCKNEAWQNGCSGTALAVLVLLGCAGRIDKMILLDLVGACLDF